jgi:protein CpxP
MNRRLIVALLLSGGIVLAQRPPRDGNPPPPPERSRLAEQLHAGPPGKWWDDAGTAQKLGMSAEQVKKMDDIFLQSRLKLIELHATLQKEETILDPLVQSEQPDDAKILVQVDKIAQTRADLEKADARMLLAIRHVLTVDQWKKLQAEVQRNGPPRPRRPGEE